MSFNNPSSKSYLVDISLSIADPSGKIHRLERSSITLQHFQSMSLSYTPESIGAHKFNLTFKMRPSDEETVVNGTFYAHIPAWLQQFVENNLAERFTYKEDVKKLGNDIEGIKKDIEGIKDEIKEIKDDVRHLNNRVDQLYSNITFTTLSIVGIIIAVISMIISLYSFYSFRTKMKEK
jgi:hypothetical protein